MHPTISTGTRFSFCSSIIIALGLCLPTFASAQVATSSNSFPLIPTVQTDDHTLGSKTAPIQLITYLDYSCKHCQAFHPTIEKILTTKQLKVAKNIAWTYRQFPITAAHPQAQELAEAAECVAKLSGEKAFWKFSKLILTTTETVNGLTAQTLARYAAASGANPRTFKKCYLDHQTKAAVAEDVASATQYGVMGTPTTYIVKGGKVTELIGDQPYQTLKATLLDLLKKAQ